MKGSVTERFTDFIWSEEGIEAVADHLARSAASGETRAVQLARARLILATLVSTFWEREGLKGMPPDTPRPRTKP